MSSVPNRTGPMERLLLLRQVPHIGALSPASLAALSGAATEIRVRAGYPLPNDDPGIGHCFIVLEGEVIDPDGQPVGPWLGFREFLQMQTSPEWMAFSTVRLLQVPEITILGLLRDDTDEARLLLTALADTRLKRSPVLFAAPVHQAVTGSEMGLVSRLQHLSRQPLMRRVNIESLASLAKEMTFRVAEADEVLREAEGPPRVVSVVRGAVRYGSWTGEAGSELGLLESFNGNTRTESVVATGPVAVLEYDPRLLLQLADSDDGLMRVLVAWFATIDPTD